MSARGTRPPALLAAAGLASVALLALPLAYLVVRAASGDAWDVLVSHNLASLIWDTGVLVVAVTASALALGVPLAWLVVRTDLPGRRLWGTAAALPLVVPSYVAALVLLAAFGPRGLLQQLLEPLGVERVPEIYGLPGAWLALTLSTYPCVFLLAASALRSLDPALEDAARGLGQRPLERGRPGPWIADGEQRHRQRRNDGCAGGEKRDADRPDDGAPAPVEPVGARERPRSPVRQHGQRHCEPERHDERAEAERGPAPGSEPHRALPAGRPGSGAVVARLHPAADAQLEHENEPGEGDEDEREHGRRRPVEERAVLEEDRAGHRVVLHQRDRAEVGQRVERDE